MPIKETPQLVQAKQDATNVDLIEALARETNRPFAEAQRHGRFATGLRIGEFVQAGQVVGGVGSDAVCAPASGVLLGLTARGARVEPGDQLVEVDSSAAAHECFGMGTGPRRVAASVLSVLSGYPMSVRGLMACADTDSVPIFLR